MKRCIPTFLASAVAVATLAACAATGRSTAESTVTGIQNLRADAEQGKAQVKSTIDSMTALENAEGGDLKPRYDAFVTETKRLESLASKAKSNGQAMRERGAAYFKTWEEQLGTMTDPDIKKRSEERRTELNGHYAELTKSMDACRAAYEKLSTNLTDIKKALDVDLSVNGVKSLSSPMKSARSNATALTSSIEDVEEKLNELAKEMNTIQGPKS
jgi:chromosome segregation ATPase